MIGNLKAVLSEELSYLHGSPRYVLVNQMNGAVVDDGNGEGYLSAHNAYKAYGYKHRDRSHDIHKRMRQQEALFWMRQNPDFVRRINHLSKTEKINAACVKRIVKEMNIEYFPFSAGEFSQIWKHL